MVICELFYALMSYRSASLKAVSNPNLLLFPVWYYEIPIFFFFQCGTQHAQQCAIKSLYHSIHLGMIKSSSSGLCDFKQCTQFLEQVRLKVASLVSVQCEDMQANRQLNKRTRATVCFHVLMFPRGIAGSDRKMSNEVANNFLHLQLVSHYGSE